MEGGGVALGGCQWGWRKWGLEGNREGGRVDVEGVGRLTKKSEGNQGMMVGLMG